ncbi:MAG TPA: hypothetical protein VGR43_02405 [Dehalococcoidia bacterium]|nr:hypothetical protein [Dehalococcoidia bacterium]
MNTLDRCVCSHPRAIHIRGGVCARCGCGRHESSAAGYTREEREEWQMYLMTDEPLVCCNWLDD